MQPPVNSVIPEDPCKKDDHGRGVHDQLNNDLVNKRQGGDDDCRENYFYV